MEQMAEMKANPDKKASGEISVLFCFGNRAKAQLIEEECTVTEYIKQYLE